MRSTATKNFATAVLLAATFVLSQAIDAPASAQGFVRSLTSPSGGGVSGPQPSASHVDQVLAVQRLLYAVGFSVDELDGNLNSSTVNAIRSFQRQNNLRVDGRVSPSLMTFLSQHAVDRMFSGDRNQIIAESEDPEGLGFDPDSRSVVGFVQRTLARVGFAPGRVDGVMVPATRQAIRDFQTRDRIRSEGEVEGVGEITPALIADLTEFEDSVLGNFGRLNEG